MTPTGRAIKTIRDSMGMSQREMAKATGISYTMVTQIESGYRVSLTNLNNISRVFGMPYNILLSYEIPNITETLDPEEKSIRSRIDRVHEIQDLLKVQVDELMRRPRKL